MPIRLCLIPALLLLIGAAPSGIERAPGEGAVRFAARVLDQTEDMLQIVDTVWNGTPTVFADYPSARINERGLRVETRELVALVRRSDGTWRRVTVTSAEEEGGIAEIAAIAFANADRDADRELIVLLKWPQVHYDYGGAFYEVRLFDTPRPPQSGLTYLAEPSRLFGGLGCDCDFRDGRRERYRFKTIAAIRRELARHGY